MVDTASSATTPSRSCGAEDKNRKEESEEDLESVNLLLTQDEWSSSSDEDDDDDQSNDDSFGGSSKKNTSTPETTTALATQEEEGNNATEASSASTALNTNATTAGTPRGNHHSSQKISASCALLSPATRTLDALSQHSSQDLRYDMSQLEHDAKTVLGQQGDAGDAGKPAARQPQKGTTEQPSKSQKQSTGSTSSSSSTHRKKSAKDQGSNNKGQHQQGRAADDRPSAKQSGSIGKPDAEERPTKAARTQTPKTTQNGSQLSEKATSTGQKDGRDTTGRATLNPPAGIRDLRTITDVAAYGVP